MGNTAPVKAKLISDAPFVGDPWDRQPQLPWKESPQAYTGFVLYRDLHAQPDAAFGNKENNGRGTAGHTFGLLKVAAAQYAEKYNRSPTSTAARFSKWNNQYRWTERVTAYENMLDAKELAERKRAIVRRTRIHANRMADAQETLMEPLRVYQERLAEIADGIRTNSLREKRPNPDTGEMEDVYTDEELLALGRASLKVVMEAQKHEREALQIDPPKSSDTKLIERRGVALRRLLDDDDASDRVEAVVFKVIEEERALESG